MAHLTHPGSSRLRRAGTGSKRGSYPRRGGLATPLDAYLAGGRATAIDRAMQEGYDRVPAATPDVWGDPADLADATTREALARLSAEEDAAGGHPW